MCEFTDVLNNYELTLVFFTASWCGPCKMIYPYFNQCSKKYPHINFIKVDCDSNYHLANKYNIQSYPTFILFNKQEVIKRGIGGNSEIIDDLLSHKITNLILKKI